MTDLELAIETARVCNDMHELDRPMALENCPLAEVLLSREIAEPGPRDQFGRRTIQLTRSGRMSAMFLAASYAVETAQKELPGAPASEVESLALKLMGQWLD